MADGFNAGELFVLLGGRLDPTGFRQFDAQMKSSTAKATAFERGLKQSMQSGQRSLDGFKRAATGAAKVGVLGLAGALAYSVKKAADFEEQMSRLGAVTGASGREMGRFKKQAMDAGAATKYSALEAAAAQTELAKGGLSVSQILNGGLNSALALAAAGELDLATAAANTVNAMKLFGLQGKDAMHIADGLATAANKTTADVGDFAIALTQGGGAAKAAGLSFDETIAALGMLAEGGVKGSDAGTSLKSMLTQLAAPTEKARGIMDDLGLSFFNADGNMRSLTNISKQLQGEFGGLSKQQRLANATALVGTDGQRALLSLYEAGPGKIRRFEQALKQQGTAAEAAKQKQDNLKGALEQLGGSVETAAITVGTELIPMLTEGAENLTQFVNSAQRNGDIKGFAEGLVDGIKDVVAFGGDAVGVIGDIGGAVGDVAGVVGPVAGALEDLIPGDLESNIMGVVGGLALFKGAMTGMAAVSSLSSPLGMARLAFVGLGVAIAAVIGHENAEEAAARRVADAKRDQADAVKALTDLEYSAADAGLASERADLTHKQAVKDLNALRKDGVKSGARYNDAVLREKETALAATQAQRRYNEELGKQRGARDRNIASANERLGDAAKDLRAAQEELDKSNSAGFTNPEKQAEAVKKLETAQREYNDAMKAFGDLNQKAAVTDLQRQRIAAGGDEITQRNRAGFQALGSVFDAIPKEKQTKILVSDQDALAKLGTFAAQARALEGKKTVKKIFAETGSAEAAVAAFEAIVKNVPKEKVTKILAETDSAKADTLAFKAVLAGVPAEKVARVVARESGANEVRALKALIDAMQSKTITITTINRIVNVVEGALGKLRATGRKAGGSETAIVGEGRVPKEYVINRRTGQGFITGGPMMTNLGPDDYVIPTDRSFSNKAFGLYTQLGRDLGVMGYEGGRKPRKRYKQGGIPYSDVEQQWETVRGDYNQASKDAGSKDKKTAESGAKRKKKLEGRYEQLKVDHRAAKKTNERALNLQSEINVLSDDMDLADRRGQKGKFGQLKKQRVAKLQALQGLLTKALNSPARGQSKRDILEQLSQIGVDLYDARRLKPTETETAAVEESAFTKGEQGTIAQLNANLAAAQVLTPDDVSDDKTILEQLLGVQSGAFARALTPGTKPALLQEAADAVRNTQDALASLRAPEKTADVSADLQAQLDQANERARIAGVDRDLNAAGLNAMSGPSITVNTLHPGDPNTLIAIGNAAAAGFSHRAGRGNYRVSLP